MQRGLSIERSECNGCLREIKNLSKQPYIRTRAYGDVPWYLPHIFGSKVLLIAVRFKTLDFFLSGNKLDCIVTWAGLEGTQASKAKMYRPRIRYIPTMICGEPIGRL